MSLTEPFLHQVLFDLDAYTNWRHYKYLGFKAGKDTCGQGYTGGVTANWKALSAFPSVLVTDGRRDKRECRGFLPGEGFPYLKANK
jgi:hypothetical protein